MELETKKCQFEDTSSELTSTKSQLQQSQEEVGELRLKAMDRDRLEKEVVEVEKELEEKEKVIKDAVKAASSAQKQLEQSNLVNSRLKSEINNVKKDMGHLQKTLDAKIDYETMKRSAQEDMNGKTQEVGNLKERLAKMSELAEHAKKKRKTAEMELEKEKNAYQTKLNQLHQEVQNIRSSSSQWKEEASSWKHEAQVLQKQLAGLNSQAAKDRQKLAAVQVNDEKWQESLNEAKNEVLYLKDIIAQLKGYKTSAKPQNMETSEYQKFPSLGDSQQRQRVQTASTSNRVGQNKNGSERSYSQFSHSGAEVSDDETDAQQPTQ